ncbi:MAG: SlyX family protein [Alphaproteobacteria bacterium]|nr:SlyX family protein [Alphaproteobacteria bacterium]
MENKILEQRLNDIEINLCNQEKVLEELNLEVIKQWQMIEKLQLQNKLLTQALQEGAVKPLSEETPPPHY